MALIDLSWAVLRETYLQTNAPGINQAVPSLIPPEGPLHFLVSITVTPPCKAFWLGAHIGNYLVPRTETVGNRSPSEINSLIRVARKYNLTCTAQEWTDVQVSCQLDHPHSTFVLL